MFRNRFLILPIFFVFWAGMAAASPLPARAFERAEVFAACAGRMAALATHQQAWNESNAVESRAVSREFDRLATAILPHAMDEGVPADQLPRWRSAGWAEMAHLLREVHYSFDARRAQIASQQLLRKASVCRRLILPVERDRGIDAADTTN